MPRTGAWAVPDVTIEAANQEQRPRTEDYDGEQEVKEKNETTQASPTVAATASVLVGASVGRR